MICSDIMDISKFEIEIKRHAFIRAMQRGVNPDMIEATIKGGKIIRFGRRNIKFERDYKKFRVICIGEVSSMKIKILTIETKGGKNEKMLGV